MNIVVDSSVIIDYIRAGVGDLPGLLDSAGTGEIKLLVPTVVILELWSGKSMESVKNRRRVDLILSTAERINLTETIAKNVGTLLREKQVGGGFDAVIAVSALESKAYLATGNRRHFSRVMGLKLFAGGEASEK